VVGPQWRGARQTAIWAAAEFAGDFAAELQVALHHPMCEYRKLAGQLPARQPPSAPVLGALTAAAEGDEGVGPARRRSPR
jgi:hypothetical protein